MLLYTSLAGVAVADGWIKKIGIKSEKVCKQVKDQIVWKQVKDTAQELLQNGNKC